MQPAPQRPPGAGGNGGRGTPGPIPNPEVKPASADGTAGATLWETRAPPAPGARCAGSGRGGAAEAPGEGTLRGPFFVCGRPLWAAKTTSSSASPLPWSAGGLLVPEAHLARAFPFGRPVLGEHQQAAQARVRSLSARAVGCPAASSCGRPARTGRAPERQKPPRGPSGSFGGFFVQGPFCRAFSGRGP